MKRVMVLVLPLIDFNGGEHGRSATQESGGLAEIIDVCKKIYLVTDDFPKEEQFGLVSQIRRAAVSVPSNLAEGAGRKRKKEFSYFLNVAQGSVSELDTQIELARMLGYLEHEPYSHLMNSLMKISKMLFGLARSVNEK